MRLADLLDQPRAGHSGEQLSQAGLEQIVPQLRQPFELLVYLLNRFENRSPFASAVQLDRVGGFALNPVAGHPHREHHRSRQQVVRVMHAGGPPLPLHCPPLADFIDEQAAGDRRPVGDLGQFVRGQQLGSAVVLIALASDFIQPAWDAPLAIDQLLQRTRQRSQLDLPEPQRGQVGHQVAGGMRVRHRDRSRRPGTLIERQLERLGGTAIMGGHI